MIIGEIVLGMIILPYQKDSLILKREIDHITVVSLCHSVWIYFSIGIKMHIEFSLLELSSLPCILLFTCQLFVWFFFPFNLSVGFLVDVNLLLLSLLILHLFLVLEPKL